MAEQQDYGIETRSRSRSKTPLRVEGVPTSKAKTPNVHTILEESETMTSTTPARTSQRVAMKEARVVLSSVSESVITSTPSSLKKNTRKTAIETQQNDKNILLETSIEAIRKGATSPNGSNASDNVAYQEYKKAGEYWNKTPKTDYTYSELSPHRREIAPNTIAMPNMSRGSLEKHHNRVNAMISRSPEQASYIRQRYGAPVARPRIDYDSSDDLDYTKYTKNQYNTSIKSTRTRRFIRTITTIFTSIFTSITSFFDVRESRESMYYTRIDRPSIFKRAFQRITNLWITIMKACYIIISSTLTLDTYILMSRSNKLKGERKRRFLIIICFLLPLLALGGIIYYDAIDTQAITKVANQYRESVTHNVGQAYENSLEYGKQLYENAGIKIASTWDTTCVKSKAFGDSVIELLHNAKNFSVDYAVNLGDNIKPYLYSK